MRKWTWLVLAAAGSVAFACGGDDDDDGGSSSTTDGSGGSGAAGGSGGTSPTSVGGSGGSGGSTTGSGGTTTGAGGSGGTTSTTGSGGTSSGGSAGGAGETGAGGMAGMAGADGGPMLTVTQACEASCTAQEASACADDYCLVFCEYSAEDFPACEAEFIEREACWGELGGDDFECDTGYPFPVAPNCEDETTAYNDCVAG